MRSSYHHHDMRSLIPIVAFFLLSACGWQSSKKPSILIIAIEQLNSEAFYCGEADTEFTEGLGVLCHDGVRFTHAFTPTTMSQAALASLLTALYPQDTGVWHNGSQYLSEKFQTVPEVAFARGYRTAFFSGGPPIWRKSGLDQGFELFEDNISLSLREIYRPVHKNFELFLNWQKESADGRPFFSLLFIPDLQFTQKTTINDLGQERALGFESQLREINESFSHLVADMKQQGIWDNTVVILAGVNGTTPASRTREIDTTNLQSEETQVLLMIKPARKPRDSGLNWTIDANVSLVDVGATLYDLLGSPENISSSSSQLDVSSLKNSLDKPLVDWSRDRFILNESAWPSWRGVGGTRLALRQNHTLFIFDQKPLIYNTLTDRFEMQPIVSQDHISRHITNEMKQFLILRGYSAWEGLPPSLVEKLRLYREFTSSASPIEVTKTGLAHLIRQRTWDKQLAGWLARLAILDKDWALLEKLGGDHLDSMWVYVAKRNRGLDADFPQDQCWQWLDKKVNLQRGQNTCVDGEFMAFAEWIRAGETQRKQAAEEKFLRAYILAEIDEEIALQNYQNSLAWDTDVNIPAEPRLVQLALTLPELKGFRQVVESRVKRR